jgi:hypothetical protein
VFYTICVLFLRQFKGRPATVVTCRLQSRVGKEPRVMRATAGIC